MVADAAVGFSRLVPFLFRHSPYRLHIISNNIDVKDNSCGDNSNKVRFTLVSKMKQWLRFVSGDEAKFQNELLKNNKKSRLLAFCISLPILKMKMRLHRDIFSVSFKPFEDES
jgi:hypothetical protein